MFLKLDRSLHPLFSPFNDTLAFVFDSLHGFATGDYAATIVGGMENCFPRGLGAKNSSAPEWTAHNSLQVWARASTPSE